MAFEILGRIGIDASDLDRLPEKVREFEHTLTGAFRRTGDIRASSALEGFVRNLTSGDVPAAIESVAQRLTGLGLLGGVAFASLTYAFSRGQEELKKMGEAAAGVQAAQFAEGLQGAMQSLQALGPIADTIQHPFSHIFTMISASSGAIQNWVATMSAGASDIARHLREEAGLREGRAEAQQLIAHGQEREGANLKALIESSQKLLQINKEQAELQKGVDERFGTSSPYYHALNDAIQQFGARSRAAVQRQFEAQQQAPIFDAAFRLRERAGVTSDELEQAGALAPNVGLERRFRQSFPAALQGDAYMLSIDNRFQSEGERYRQLGLRQEAATMFAESDRIKAQIGSLRESEKAPEYQLKNAIDSAQVFKEILGALRQIDGSVRSISFKNI